MKFFDIHVAMGSAPADMNAMVPHVESTRCSVTNSAYTGTMMAVIGRQVPKMIVYRNGLLNRDW